MIKVNLFDNNFAHTLECCGYLTNTYLTKPTKIEWQNKLPEFDGLTVFTDGYIFSPEYDNFKGRKAIWLVEPRSISPDLYRQVEDNFNKFDCILTFDKNLLIRGKLSSKSPTVKIAIGQSRISDEDAKFYDKTKLVSMIASHKTMSEGHRFRHEIVQKLHSKHNFELWGSGYRPFEEKLVALKDYCFSISVLNCKRDNYFTEILVDNFRTFTIPIFWGCPNIGDYFNTDGIITFDTIEELDEILKNLTTDDYVKRGNAMKENFELAKKYLITDDIIADILVEKKLV